jgi:hypothetical protein
MSMYTELLVAAWGQQGPAEAGATERGAFEEVLRCRARHGESVRTGAGPDLVPVVLALELAYDVALLRLALVVGVETDPSRFDQPRRERDRLEGALRALGISLEPASDSDNRSSPVTP